MTKDERERLIERYAAGADEVTRSLDGFPAEAMATRPIAGKWSAREIVHHLGDSESISGARLRLLLVEEHPVIHGYDEARFAVVLRYNERDHRPSLDLFRNVRAVTTALLRTLGDADWSRQGWHSDLGLYTTGRWLEIYAAHAHNHAAQIRRLKDALTV
jgi:hypothetical protein